MNEITVGFAMCGSFCTFEAAFVQMKRLVERGYAVLPVMSFNAASLDTRFGSANEMRERAGLISGRDPITTIEGAEPVGPKAMCDILAVIPCTGNTLAKLSAGITDTPVTMAVKSHLRRGKPVVIAVSTNDGLSAAARNIGELLNRKNYYFVPMKQDAPEHKPCSVVAELSLVSETVKAALAGKQLQPVYI